MASPVAQLPASGPTIHKAEPIPGPDGTVEWWGESIAEADAVADLLQGHDIVIRGSTRCENRNKARELMMKAFGGFEEDEPHNGRMALPHFHPPARSPEVHAFFESSPRHAKKRNR